MAFSISYPLALRRNLCHLNFGVPNCRIRAGQANLGLIALSLVAGVSTGGHAAQKVQSKVFTGAVPWKKAVPKQA